ncbi:MAG: hypothetical protein ASARMPREDX12_000864 [Alectoria sarmentosa]|nr:MAG: hypothetical protein ASARMPREDX12_000864 [Alectoria sarmentosa]
MWRQVKLAILRTDPLLLLTYLPFSFPHRSRDLDREPVADGCRIQLQLSLSHFCENDGPTSILCTQIKPVECLSCYPGSISSSVGDLEAAHRDDPTRSAPAFLPSSNRSSLDFGGTPESVPTSVSTSPELPPASLGAHRQNALRPLYPLNRFPIAGSNGRGCESCTISLPDEISRKLPPGAPGSPKPDGSGRNGSPILRFRESLQIYRDQQTESDSDEERGEPIPLNQQSSPESFASDTSASFYHKHTLSYISTSSPTDQNTYSIIRRAAIRTLSGEQLPRGQTAGELFFGTPLDGWTIAYKFRLSDPYARGGHRKYALIALASSESRAYQGITFIWENFRRIAGNIITKTALKIKENETDGDDHEDLGKEHRIPVKSFLTGRTTDPDGYPRQYGAARMRARGLTEMVGDDKFFAELHLDFVGMLRELMGGYGG